MNYKILFMKRIEYQKETMRQPGVEPGSTMWKAFKLSVSKSKLAYNPLKYFNIFSHTKLKLINAI